MWNYKSSFKFAIVAIGTNFNFCLLFVNYKNHESWAGSYVIVHILNIAGDH